MTDSVRGFIFQASYRLQDGIPVVYLYGILEGGGTFLVRDHNQVPHLYIRQRDSAHAKRLGVSRQVETGCQTFDGDTALRVDVDLPRDLPSIRERLEANQIDTFEADIRFAMRYLIDRDIRGGCEITGVWTTGEQISRIYDNPKLRSAEVKVEPSVLSFDIETNPSANRLLSIALYGLGVDEVYIFDAKRRSMPENAIGFRNESQVLDAFISRIHALNPDVLTGWNVIDFDLKVLEQIAKRLRMSIQVGRDAGPIRLRPPQGYFGGGQASIPGRLVLDGIDLVRGAFMRFDDYSLNNVASQVLGEGKVEIGKSANRAEDILTRYRNDLETFAEYARTDARLALEIVEKLNLVTLAIARSKLTGMTPDRVAASIASFDFRYLAALGKRKIVAPSVRSADNRVSRHQAGGHVFEPVTGIHENVWMFDFKSLYPSVIRTFNIDPLGFVTDQESDDEVIRVTDDATFRRCSAILPEMLDELFPQREAAKRNGDAIASHAIKILMNSFYGVLGTPACRFHNVAIANAVTGTGRRLLQWSKRWFEERGFSVLYGDTDSVFVGSGMRLEDARNEGGPLSVELNDAIANYIQETWQVTSRLEMEYEKLYLKLFLPSVRHGGAGARKRYAGLVDGYDEVEFTGMEVVRRDWTELAKDIQRELFKRLFADKPVDDYLTNITTLLRQGELDHKLVYHKGLRKNLSAYTANTPPHVAAARKSRNPGRVISYLMTVAGPEPLDALQNKPDHGHYLDKQVRPVAEPVLAMLGLDFDETIGDNRQMSLF